MANKYKVLIIEDEQNILDFVAALLESGGYQVLTAGSCRAGEMMFSSHQPDLVILDLGLPDDDGISLLRYIRKSSAVPVIVLSARTGESDKVEALDNGANDYVTKPFGSAEFMARVRSALRNTSRNMGGDALGGIFELGGFTINYDSRRVYIDGGEIRLTQTEYNIVALLSKHCGKVMTYSSIISAIWGYNDFGSKKKLQVNMANIRKKFGAVPGREGYIINELGVGYRMNEDAGDN